MRIGEVAELTGTPVDTIRYYERQGLLTAPGRSPANYRTYASEQVDRLHFIRRCRALDISLQEIRSLLVFCDEPGRHCTDVNDLLDEHIRHVDERIEELQRLARDLKQLRSVCRRPGSADRCEILKTLRSGGSCASRSGSMRRSHAR